MSLHCAEGNCEMEVMAESKATQIALDKPADSLLKPIHVEERLLAGAGPFNLSPRVQAACNVPQVIPSVMSQLEMKQIMADVRAGLQYGFQTRSPYVFCVSACGHGAMESLCQSLLEPGEVFLLCQNGFWASRMKIMADRYDIDTRVISKNYGEVFSMEEIEQGLKEHRPRVLFVTMGESSAGTLQPIEQLGTLCHSYDCLLMVDTVAAMGAVPFFMDKWGIDIVYSGAQKVLSAATGISPVALSQAAWEKATKRQTKIRSLFLDATLLAKMWGCENNQPSYQHSPYNINIYCLREALSELAEEGLEQSWAKHSLCSSLLQKGLEDLGITIFGKTSNIRLPTVLTVAVPDDLKAYASDIVEYMATSLKVAISMGFAPGSCTWRIGLMGYTATPANVEKVLTALATALQWARDDMKQNPGKVPGETTLICTVTKDEQPAASPAVEEPTAKAPEHKPIPPNFSFTSVLA